MIVSGWIFNENSSRVLAAAPDYGYMHDTMIIICFAAIKLYNAQVLVWQPGMWPFGRAAHG